MKKLYQFVMRSKLDGPEVPTYFATSTFYETAEAAENHYINYKAVQRLDHTCFTPKEEPKKKTVMVCIDRYGNPTVIFENTLAWDAFNPDNYIAIKKVEITEGEFE